MNTTPARIRVLVVDDSAFMRRAITKMLERESDIEIVATAETGEEAIKLAESLRPDVMTMDVEMPGMGGIEALKKIVERRGPPVIMISSLTRQGAETTLHALEIGAVDFIPKPDSAFIDILKVQVDLVAKVRAFARRRHWPPPLPPLPQRISPFSPSTLAPPVARTAFPPRPVPAAPPPERLRTGPPIRAGRFECIALGTSTGGPVALSRILPSIPRNFTVPIVIVQHMPPGFTRPLADRLNAASAIDVIEGEDGMAIRSGTAVIAPAGKQVRLTRTMGGVLLHLEDDKSHSLHVPSVDVMAASVGEIYGAAALGVILTGMGSDGVEGLKVIKARGGTIVGQDEATSVVYGMPRAAAQAGLVDRVVALDDVARTLCELTGVSYASL